MPTNLIDVVAFIKTLPVNDVIILDQTNYEVKILYHNLPKSQKKTSLKISSKENQG